MIEKLSYLNKKAASIKMRFRALETRSIDNVDVNFMKKIWSNSKMNIKGT